MNIGIDIDGVLTNMYEAVIDLGTKFCYENNIKYKIDSNNYYEGRLLGISDEDIGKFWNQYLGEYTTSFPSRRYASEVVKKLKVNNKIFIITARNEDGLEPDLYGKMQSIVKNWLKKNEIVYDKLIFSSGSKLDICLKNEIDIMIEDSPKNIKELKEKIKIICFDNPYNKDDNDNVLRAYSWYDIINIINNI